MRVEWCESLFGEDITLLRISVQVMIMRSSPKPSATSMPRGFMRTPASMFCWLAYTRIFPSCARVRAPWSCSAQRYFTRSAMPHSYFGATPLVPLQRAHAHEHIQAHATPAKDGHLNPCSRPLYSCLQAKNVTAQELVDI